MANTYIKYDDIDVKNIILRNKRNRPEQAGTKRHTALRFFRRTTQTVSPKASWIFWRNTSAAGEKT